MLGDKTILIVEDEAMIACDLEDVVLVHGAKVAELCLDLESALGVARDGAFDAAILDYNIGGKTVYPVADILLQRGIPFVFNTAIGERELLEKRYAGVQVCRKPISDRELIDALERALLS
jgi:CheY-like chemotaxis protein